MRSDFMLAINQLCAERKLSPEVVLEAVEASLISAYKRNFGAVADIKVEIEPNTGDVRVYAAKNIVDEVVDPKLEISVEEALVNDPEAKSGGTVLIETTPRDFGRIAAQTAKQVILQRIREAERDALYTSFADSAGEIAHGTIQSVDYHSGDVIVNLDGAEALLPGREQVPSEHYRRGSRLRAYVVDVRRGNRGPQITLSRRSPALLRRLLELEVPEIFNGSVEIKGMAREAGSRSKVAVHATQDGVDPVGSCVGVRGGRIQNVVNELGGEKIDVVHWNADMGTFIANSLSPAKVMNVLLDENPNSGKTATVIVPDRQLSLAIGKEGQNARLAAKLTGWRIDIKSATEATEETWGKLQDADRDPEDMDLLTLAETLLRKQKDEGFNKEQQEQIMASLEETSEQDIPWPKEPGAEAESAEGETAPTAALEAQKEAEGVTEAAEIPAQELVDELGKLEGLDEQEPTFEGEPVEDSLGWVRTEPEDTYYTGWGKPEEEPEEELGWIQEELKKEVESREGTQRKKKKKKGKRVFEEDLNDQGWDWRGYSRK